MRKLIFAAGSLIMFNSLSAQPWMPKGAIPVKFSDVVKNYPMAGAADKEIVINPDGEQGEGKNHLVQKWDWYWRQHLDKDGYIVPPVKTLTEWLEYTHNTKAAKTTSIPSNWVFQGPTTTPGGYSGIGRINIVAFDPVDSNTFYIGSPAGSTWKTTDGGLTWTPLYNNLPTLGVADIKINPHNRNTIYVATGDGDAGDAYSSGIIVSHDAGATWSTAGLSWLPTLFNNARSILINPSDTNTILLGTNNGSYITHNAGASWTATNALNFKQLIYKPGDTNTIYGTIYTDTTCQIVKSVNAGVTFTAVTSLVGAQRINVAVSPANPSLVMALASDSSSGLLGIYKSVNSGASFTLVYHNDTSCTHELLGWDIGLPTTSCGGQGWYDLCISVSPTNASDVTIGGVNSYYSSDDGNSWTVCNGWYDNGTSLATVHADKHCLAYHPLTGALFETCDGGIYKNYGPLTSPWINLSNGLGITEFYRISVDNHVPFCIGGCQDDGTKMVNAGVATDLTGGDGMQPLINYGNPANIWYTSSQNGNIDMTRDAGANYHSITDTIHDNGGGWISPYLLHPTDTATLLLAFKNLYISHNNGLSWTSLSPVFDSSSSINFIAWAPANTNYIYAEYDDYNVWKSVVYYTANMGATWDTIHIPFTNFISDVVVDPKNAKHIWVTVSGYSSTDKVYSYNLATNIWTNETGTLPNLPVDCLVCDTLSGTLYIGTDAAVFYKDTTMTDWALFNTHLPTVHVADLKINYATGDLWAGTFGRGMWKSTKANNPGTLAVKQITEATTLVSPNPSHGSFTITTTDMELMNGPVQVKLITADGKIALNTANAFDGSGRMKINTSGLTPGFYICEVSSGALVTHVRVVVD